MWEIMSDKLPYSELETSDWRSEELGKLRPNLASLSPVFPSEMTILMQETWSTEPERRPSFIQLDDQMISIKSRIPDYKGQVRESRIQVLNLHNITATGSSFGSQIRTYSMASASETHLKQIHPDGTHSSVTTTNPVSPPNYSLFDSRNLSHTIANDLHLDSSDLDEKTCLLPPSSDIIPRLGSEINFDVLSSTTLTNDVEVKTSSRTKQLCLLIILLTCFIIATSVGIWEATKQPDDPDQQCTSIRGKCYNWFEHKCISGYRSGLCSGDENIKCCLPCDITCQNIEASYNDSRCDSIHGICQDDTNYCSREYVSGKCQGPGSRLCCPPDPLDENCTKRDGICQDWTQHICTAGYRSGLCPGQSAIKCCLPCDAACQAAEDTFHDPDCDNIHGICMDNTNYCPTGYLSGKCHGPNTRQCCPP